MPQPQLVQVVIYDPEMGSGVGGGSLGGHVGVGWFNAKLHFQSAGVPPTIMHFKLGNDPPDVTEGLQERLGICICICTYWNWEEFPGKKKQSL